MKLSIASVILILLATYTYCPAAPPQPTPVVSESHDGSLRYLPDDQGNRVPDFSYAGYMSGQSAIPDLPVRVKVTPIPGDNTARIQSAIDYVSALPPDAHGFRGAILLDKGRYELSGGLWIRASGVVLRGQGPTEDGTVLIATGVDRRTLIQIAGKNDQAVDPDSVAIDDHYLPVNSTKLHLAKPSAFKVGDTLIIRRPSTADWIKTLQMVDLGGGLGLGWKPGTRDISWDRTVTAIDANELTIDAPLTTAIESQFGGGTLASYTWPGRISQVGVENLRCESAFDPQNLKDESHSWMAVTFESAQDSWVRQMTFAHFVGSAVSVWESSKRITIEDCRSFAPVSEIGGYRRHTFFTNGQLTLFQDCWSEFGRHDFSVGNCAAGPNVFVQCQAVHALDDSGPIDSWASGVLYDLVHIDGNPLSLGNRGYKDQFVGWSAANSVLWQCQAPLLICPKPPTAQNWSFGGWGEYSGDGYWARSNETIRPFSLYYGQLADRIGNAAATRDDLMPVSSEPSSSPSIALAQTLIAASTQPAQKLSDWIDQASQRHPIPTDPGDAKSIDDIPAAVPPAKPASASPLAIQNGWLVFGDRLAVGGRESVMWWQGGIRDSDLSHNKTCLTRFVPGRDGPGLTDDLNQLTDSMLGDHLIALEHNYGLWYDERDVDHERIQRMNGDVWPPFYELPFARSGIGVEWDGLSKYDLLKYNPWYFSRLKQFADLCDAKGLVLMNKQFFQHNIIEDGAHWATCPWRSFNNINDTGFPEPPPYVGDKRIFMAEQFYDLNNSVRRHIYESYIRKCLDNASGNTNVVQLTGEEFTGPLPFMQFWLDTVAQWEKETGKKVIVGLSATKDVQDAILADPARSPIVSAIDIRQWWYQSNGDAYAPPGGKNLSPRQLARIIKHTASSFEQVARAVREYRQKYPDKAVIYSSDGEGNFGWAALMGGASLATVRTPLDEHLLAAIPHMHPIDLPNNPSDQFVLADPGNSYLIYSTGGETIKLDLPAGSFTQQWINPKNGRMTDPKPVASSSGFKSPGGGMSILWISHS